MPRGRRLFTKRCLLITIFFAGLVFYGQRESVGRHHPRQTQKLSNIDIYNALWETSNNLKNQWLYFRDHVENNQTKIVDDGYIAMNINLMKIIQMSEEERKHKLEQMSLFIQRKITKLQHPGNCQTARILLCDVRNCCGFGSNLQSLVSCLLQAFVSGRTTVYRSKGWKYAEEGWTYAFLPLGNCTDDTELTSVPTILDDVNNTRVVSMFDIKQPPWIDWSVPTQIKNELQKLHGHPFAWWLSQFTKYTVRPRPWLKRKINETKKTINFTSSVVGIQVRRGDKIGEEADKHEVSEYMNFVERWQDQLKHRGQEINRTVYLATDEPKVLTELKSSYPNYKFIGLHTTTSLAYSNQQRGKEELESVILDIYFLSQCDYLVCTLTSNVCRIAYHLMMDTHADASLRMQSLDTGFHFMFNDVSPPMIAIMDHDPITKDELQLRKGDTILVELDYHFRINKGFLRGRSPRTNKTGKFPVFKVREQLFSYNASELQSFAPE